MTSPGWMGVDAFLLYAPTAPSGATRTTESVFSLSREILAENFFSSDGVHGVGAAAGFDPAAAGLSVVGPPTFSTCAVVSVVAVSGATATSSAITACWLPQQLNMPSMVASP